jgi:hypothetical protein
MPTSMSLIVDLSLVQVAKSEALLNLELRLGGKETFAGHISYIEIM